MVVDRIEKKNYSVSETASIAQLQRDLDRSKESYERIKQEIKSSKNPEETKKKYEKMAGKSLEEWGGAISKIEHNLEKRKQKEYEQIAQIRKENDAKKAKSKYDLKNNLNASLKANAEQKKIEHEEAIASIDEYRKKHQDPLLKAAEQKKKEHDEAIALMINNNPQMKAALQKKKEEDAIKAKIISDLKDSVKASFDKNAELAEAAEEAEANSGQTPVDASTTGDEGWWSWLRPDDFFKALDPTRPPITFQSILKFLVLINFVAGGFLAMYELNVKGFSAIDFQLVFISIFIGLYGYLIYKL